MGTLKDLENDISIKISIWIESVKDDIVTLNIKDKKLRKFNLKLGEKMDLNVNETDIIQNPIYPI